MPGRFPTALPTARWEQRVPVPAVPALQEVRKHQHEPYGKEQQYGKGVESSLDVKFPQGLESADGLVEALMAGVEPVLGVKFLPLEAYAGKLLEPPVPFHKGGLRPVYAPQQEYVPCRDIP